MQQAATVRPCGYVHPSHYQLPQAVTGGGVGGGGIASFPFKLPPPPVHEDLVITVRTPAGTVTRTKRLHVAPPLPAWRFHEQNMLDK